MSPVPSQDTGDCSTAWCRRRRRSAWWSCFHARHLSIATAILGHAVGHRRGASWPARFRSNSDSPHRTQGLLASTRVMKSHTGLSTKVAIWGFHSCEL